MPSPSPVAADAGTIVEQLLESLDPPTCEVYVDKVTRRRCGKPATWLLASSCGHTFYYCGECRGLLLLAATRDAGVTECDQHGEAPVRVRLDWVRL